MLCRSCGMETRTTDRCEWCKKPIAAPAGGQPLGGPAQAAPAAAPLSAPQLNAAPLLGGQVPASVVAPPAGPAQPLNQQPQAGYAPAAQAPAFDMPGLPQVTQQMTAAPPAPAPGGAPPRMSLSGEIIDTPPVAVVAAPPAYPGAPLAGVPVSATASAAAGMPVGAYSAAAMDSQIKAATSVPVGERWEKFLAIALPTLIVSLLIVHLAPGAFLPMAYFDVFAIGLIMGATGAIPAYDDAFADCTIVIVLCFLFGPLIALALYGVVCLIRQECNAAVIGLLVSNIVTRALLSVAFASSVDTISMIAVIGFLNFLVFFAVIASFAGWILSSFFRPVEEV